MTPRQFRVHVPDEVLADLRERLARTRWPDEVEGAGWDYGSDLAYMKELVEYWRTKFDWRAQEERINRFAHFQAEVDGQTIHFIHERGRGPNAVPLLVTHGWPGSFYEMHKIIPLLTDPAAHGGDPKDAFDVVVPSLPGYGFSARPKRRGITKAFMADLWVKLMTGLGYQRFAAHGGDIGAGVTTRMGLSHGEHLLGIHVTAVARPYLGPDSAPLTDAERAYMELQEQWERDENGYGHQQGTRPQTLAFGLNDSPAGLAAWIVEKFRAWSDCGGDTERSFSKDELLTNITIYWVTQTIHSSMRLYFDHRRDPGLLGSRDRVNVPTGVCLTREPVDLAPREWAERSYRIQSWTELPRGGHFAALEEPEFLANDIRQFFRFAR